MAEYGNNPEITYPRICSCAAGHFSQNRRRNGLYVQTGIELYTKSDAPGIPSESRCAVPFWRWDTHITGNQQYLAAANQAFAQVQGVFRDSEIVEQTGPICIMRLSL